MTPPNWTRRSRQAVKEVVDKQVAYGVDVVGDGEESKPSFNLYLDERISGFEMKLPPPGQVPTMSMDGRDRTDFREFYAEESGFGLSLVSSAYAVREQQICTGPLSYIGHDHRRSGRGQLPGGAGGRGLCRRVHPHPRPRDHRPPPL